MKDLYEKANVLNYIYTASILVFAVYFFFRSGNHFYYMYTIVQKMLEEYLIIIEESFCPGDYFCAITMGIGNGSNKNKQFQETVTLIICFTMYEDEDLL